jgi:HD-GYP domain-containing protein (c-di-GMP phosphodiesterase class II)
MHDLRLRSNEYTVASTGGCTLQVSWWVPAARRVGGKLLMGAIPLKSRIGTMVMVAIAMISMAVAFQRSTWSWDSHQLAIALLLGSFIVAAEIADISFPHSAGSFFSVSVGSPIALAAGLALGPLRGGTVVLIAILLESLYARRAPIKTAFNMANHGLSTIFGAATFEWLADPARTPLGSSRNMLAVVAAALAFTLINTTTLAIVVAPVIGISPLRMYRTHLSGIYIEMITLPTLGAIVPVLARESALALIVLLVPLVGPLLALKSFNRAREETQEAMAGLADVLERRDPSTLQHSVRVSELVRAMLDELPHVPFETAQGIITASRVHDLGKVGISDLSFRKPGALTDEERTEIQDHAAIGAEIVERLWVYRPWAAVIRHHHEHWDGQGYPDGLAGEHIPLGSRIIGVADAFDAMTSDRVYRSALSQATALEELRAKSGTQFDPQIVAALERVLDLQAVPGRCHRAPPSWSDGGEPGHRLAGSSSAT